MSVRFVHGADVVQVDTVVAFQSFRDCGGETGKVFIMVGLQVECAAAPCVGGQSVARIIHGRGIEKSNEGFHASFFSLPEKPALPFLFAWVECALRADQAFRTHPRRGDATFMSLCCAAGSDVEPPNGKTDASGAAIAFVVCAEEPVCDLETYTVSPRSYVLHAPCIGCPEAVDGLEDGVCVYLEMICFFLGLHGN